MTASRLLVLLVALVLTLAAAGCGDDDSGGGGEADQEITDVLNAGLKSEDPKVVCEETPSDSLIERTYGDVTACRKIESEDAKDNEPATSVDVSNIEVDGSKATASVSLKGGDNDGAEGSVSLVEQDGEWRVDDLSPDFLRSQLKAGLAKDTEIPEQTKTCLTDRILALDDAKLRELAYGSIGEKPAAQRELLGFIRECDRKQGGGETALRQQFEKGLEESLRKDGLDDEAIECVKRELRDLISDDDIVEIAGQGGEVSPEVTRKSAQALKACGANPG